MAQMKTALELYAEKNNFNYPALALTESDGLENTTKISSTPNNKVLSLFASPVYAAIVHTEPACLRFDQLAELLVSRGYMPGVPRDPQDAPTGTCYKAASIDTDGDPATVEAVTGYAILWEKYKTPTNGEFGNKKTGFIVSKSQEIDETLTASVCSTTGEYPILDLSSVSNLCTRNADGKVADRILGVTDGAEFASTPVASDAQSDTGSDTGSDTSSDQPSDTGSDTGYCSNSAYTDKASCELDRSTCSNPAYSNETDCRGNGETTGAGCSNPSYFDQYSCTTNGAYSGASCSDSTYTSQSTCEANGTYSGGSCSDASYTSSTSCTGAQCSTGGGTCSGGGYTDSSNCVSATCAGTDYCSNSTYTDSSSCTNAQCESGGSCNGGGYTDPTSCSSAQCGGSAAYCGNGVSGDPESCENAGSTWYPETPTYNCGYSWVAGYTNCGYSWNTGSSVSCGYTWTVTTANCGHVWYPGNYTQNTWYQGTFTNYTWSSGTFTSYTWTSVPGSTWNQQFDIKIAQRNEPKTWI